MELKEFSGSEGTGFFTSRLNNVNRLGQKVFHLSVSFCDRLLRYGVHGDGLCSLRH